MASDCEEWEIALAISRTCCHDRRANRKQFLWKKSSSMSDASTSVLTLSPRPSNVGSRESISLHLFSLVITVRGQTASHPSKVCPRQPASAPSYKDLLERIWLSRHWVLITGHRPLAITTHPFPLTPRSSLSCQYLPHFKQIVGSYLSICLVSSFHPFYNLGVDNETLGRWVYTVGNG